MKKYLKLILAGIILFAPFSLLIYLGQSASIIAVGFGMSTILVAILHADSIKSLSVSLSGTKVELKEARAVMDKAIATIEMLENSQKPILSYLLELMYSEGMFMSTSLKSKSEAFNDIKSFIDNSTTYDKTMFNSNLRHAVSGVSRSAASDFRILYEKYFRENQKQLLAQKNLDKDDLYSYYSARERELGSYIDSRFEGDDAVAFIDYEKLTKFGNDELTGEYRTEWGELVSELKDFNEQNKY